jgi:ADP-heptose:LPS heptosyltransferase
MWPLEHYAKLITELIAQYKATVIIIGDKTESAIAAEIVAKVQHPNLLNAVGQTTIIQMVVLINNSDLFIGNDSGPLHIAIALKVPTIGIFGFTAPEQLIPLQQDHVVVKTASSKPLYIHQPFLQFGYQESNALRHVSVSEVMEAVYKLLTSANSS